MTPPIPPASARVQEAGAALGLPVAVMVHEVPTRTAEEAAAAAGCELGAIVKSLVFVGRESGDFVLLLVSGANRVDLEKAARAIGEPIDRPDGKAVRTATGFAIGGIPPFGHATPLATFLDEDLLAFGEVWAAAGTPNTVFAIDPERLAAATGARRVALA